LLAATGLVVVVGAPPKVASEVSHHVPPPYQQPEVWCVARALPVGMTFAAQLRLGRVATHKVVVGARLPHLFSKRSTAHLRSSLSKV
jgi:hypothetical protein